MLQSLIVVIELAFPALLCVCVCVCVHVGRVNEFFRNVLEHCIYLCLPCYIFGHLATIELSHLYANQTRIVIHMYISEVVHLLFCVF